MQRVEHSCFTGSTGLPLAAVIHIPDGSGPFPAVLVLHGFMGFKEEVHITEFASQLCENGFLALRFDATGFGKSGGSPERDYRVGTYLSDAKLVYSALKQRPDVIPSRTGVCGHSLGAGLSIIVAAQVKAAACCAVQPGTKVTRPSGSRPLSIWDGKEGVEFESECPDYRKFSLPREFALDADRFDVRIWVKDLKCPLQIMYGTTDATVAPEDTLSIYECAPPGTALVTLDGYDHNFWLERAKLDFVTQTLVGFFRQSLLEELSA